MSKKALARIVSLTLLIFLTLLSIVILWNIVDSLIDKTTGKLEIEALKKTLEAEKVKSPVEESELGCISNWQCGGWSDCEVTYNLDDIIGEEILLKGKRQRGCEDLNGCSLNKIEEETCDTKVPVSVEKIIKCSKEYIEIRDEEGVLISRLELTEDSRELNIQLLLGDVEYCPYCYDNEKNYDENEVDCVYEGDSCSYC